MYNTQIVISLPTSLPLPLYAHSIVLYLSLFVTKDKSGFYFLIILNAP